MKKHSIQHLAAVIGILGIVGGAREQAWANDIAFREVIRRTDFVSVGVGGLRNNGNGTMTLAGVSGPVHHARLYWAGPSNSTNGAANASITFNGRIVAGEQIGFTSDNCWGFANSQAYRADVTDIVTAKGNGAYALTGLVSQGTNINANGASLLVFFKDNIPANDRDVVLFDGNDSNAPNSHDAMGWNVRLGGIRYTNGAATIQLHVSDGQAYRDGAIKVNGKMLLAPGGIFSGLSVPAANNGPINNGKLWDIRNLSVTPFLRPGTNALHLTHNWIQPAGDCVSLVVAAINLPAGAAPPDGPELTNNAPSVIADPELLINTPNPVVVHAEVADIDGDELTTAISLNGALTFTGRIEKGTPKTTGMLLLTNAFALGEHSIRFAATDGKLGADCIMALRVVDNTPPVLTLPPNISTSTDPGKSTAVVTFTATATDDFDGVVPVHCIPEAGSAFAVGVNTVTCTARDSSSNLATGTFTVTVRDGVPPTICCPGDLVRSACRGGAGVPVTFVVIYTDNQPGVTLSCVPPSGSLFPPGATTVNCTARDTSGNTAVCSFKVTVADREAPVIACPRDMTVNNDPGLCSAVVNYTVRVTDNSLNPVLQCAPASGSVFPVGKTKVNCTATDNSGNSSKCYFNVTVLDCEKPVLVLPQDIVTAIINGCSGNGVNYTVTATDNCSTPVVVCYPKSGTVFPAGTTIVRCTATDSFRNVATGSFKVIVRDVEPPTIKYIKHDLRQLRSPNDDIYAITLKVNAKDNNGSVTSRIVSITSGTPGAPASNIVITGPLTANLKAGHTYTIRVEVADNSGNAIHHNETVVIPPSSKK